MTEGQAPAPETLPICVTVELHFNEYEQAFSEVRKAVYAKQARNQPPWRVFLKGLMGGVVFGAALIWGVPYVQAWDPYSGIRPGTYSLVTLSVPLLIYGLSAILWTIGPGGFLRVLPGLLVILAAGAFLLWASSGSPAAGLQTDWFGTLFPHTFWLLLMAYITWLMLANRRKAALVGWEGQPRLQVQRVYRFDAEGFEVDDAVEQRRTRWSAIRRFSETRDTLLLWSSELSFEILPRRAFTAQQLTAARRLFTDRVTNAQHVPMAFEVLPSAPAEARPMQDAVQS